MDATRIAIWVCAVCLCALIGCQLPGAKPSSQQETQEPVRREEPPVVVENSAPAETGQDRDGLEQRVLEWAERIDDVASRTADSRSAAPVRSQSGGAYPLPWLASDTQTTPPSTQPTGQQPSGRTATRWAPGSEPPPAENKPTKSTSTDSESTPANPTPAAPTLDGVTVHGEPSRSSRKTEPTQVQPAVNMPATAAGAPVSLEQFVEQWQGRMQDSSFREQLDVRILHVVAGDYARGRQPLELVSQEQQTLASRYIEALIAIRETHMGDLSGTAPAALKELDQLAEELRGFSALTIPTLEICREVRGFGQYQTIDPPRFAAGAGVEFVVYCELRDFASEHHDDGMHYTRFDMRTAILTHAGDTVLELKDTDIVDRCRNRRRDCFIPRLVSLPHTLSPGAYVIKITVVDKVAEKVAEQRATFRIVAGS